MTTGEEHYPPPRHRRPLSEPPSPGEEADQTGGSSQSDWFEQQFGSHTDQEDTSEEGADTVEGPTVDYDPGHALPGPTQLPGLDDPARPRMPGGEPRRHHPETPAEYGAAANPAYDTGQHQFVQPAPQPGHHPGASTGQYAPYPQGGWPQPSGAPSRTNPLPLIGAVAALLAAAGLVGWMFSGSGDDQEVTIGGAQTGGAEAASTTDVPPLSPASLPQADEEGLVGIELALIDPYTGTGSTGSVELYLNSVTGKVCHIFEIGSLTGRYRAYIHEAEFPREGPIVVDLGEVANSVPRCVNASPIDVTRALAGSGGFYVAAHGPDREVVLRAQMSAATMAFDNRDPELLAS
ncbi:MAG: hypothetical protein OER95_19130, partial [Acidimicrobiia bacterium]|nr:hypothetical protein [Acidimicrobiia bacterium]